MNPLSTNIASKLNNQPSRRTSESFVSSKRRSVLADNIHELKQRQREFNDKIEDNQLRKQKIATLIQEFEACNTAVETPSPNSTSSSRNRLMNESISVAEKILGYLNIDINIVSTSTSDSAIEIDAIKNNDNLFLVLKLLIPRLTSLPYTFLSQIKLRSLQFCEDIRQVNPNHITIYKQKLINGLMPVSRLRTDDKVLKHLCRILMYSMYKNVNDFGTEWKDFTDELGSVTEKTVYEDLAEVFYALLRLNDGKRAPSAPGMELKVNELRKRLKEFDPAGINYEWTTKKGERDENTTEEDRDKENALFLTSNNPAHHKW